MDFYAATVALYLADSQHPRGCLVFCTAPAESMEQPEIRAALLGVLTILDQAFESRFQAAMQTNRFHAQSDVKQTAAMASAVMHSLALRARAGQSRKDLLAFAAAATAMLVKAADPE